MTDLLGKLRGGLVVSCQRGAARPAITEAALALFRPAVMAASLGGDGPLLGALMQHLDRSGS